MFKIKPAFLIFSFFVATSAASQSVLDLAEQERAKKAGEITYTAPQPAPLSAADLQRRDGKIPLEEISLIGVQGVDGDLRAEVVSRAGATATLSMTGRRNFGGWRVTEITSDYVVLSTSSNKLASKHTIYLSAVRESKLEPLTTGAGQFNSPSTPIPLPSPSF